MRGGYKTVRERASMTVVPKKILMPLPDHDFDVTEVAVPWRLLTDAGYEVVFATEEGSRPAADPLLLEGVVFGRLGAEDEPRAFYRDLVTGDANYGAPIRWDEIEPDDYAGMVLPGGHAAGMRQYLGSEALQNKVEAVWSTGRPVGAICHGVLVLSRTRDGDGKSLLAEMRSTCLPKYMERAAFYSTFWRRGRYYRTYRAYVEDEVRASMTNADTQFERGPKELSKRGTRDNDGPAFVVVDGRYVSARWPGDAYLFAKQFIKLLETHAPHGS